MAEVGEKLRIGDIASRAGVSSRALRYYEEKHLLTPERTTSGQRVYHISAVARVLFIQQLFAAGLSSRTILDVLPCMDSGHATPEILGVLVAERDRIALGIAELNKAHAQLERMISATLESNPDIRRTGQAAAAAR